MMSYESYVYTYNTIHTSTNYAPGCSEADKTYTLAIKLSLWLQPTTDEPDHGKIVAPAFCHSVHAKTQSDIVSLEVRIAFCLLATGEFMTQVCHKFAPARCTRIILSYANTKGRLSSLCVSCTSRLFACELCVRRAFAMWKFSQPTSWPRRLRNFGTSMLSQRNLPHGVERNVGVVASLSW